MTHAGAAARRTSMFVHGLLHGQYGGDRVTIRKLEATVPVAPKQELGSVDECSERGESPFPSGAQKGKLVQERYFFTDRPEAVSGREDDSETAWQEFQRLASGQAAMEQGSVVTPRAAAAARAWQATDVLALMERHHRVCPKPEAWFALHALLLEHAAPPDVPPPPPADADAWRKTSSMAKSICFSDHLRWAERRPAAFQSAAEFLLALPEHAWHHAEQRPAAAS